MEVLEALCDLPQKLDNGFLRDNFIVVLFVEILDQGASLAVLCDYIKVVSSLPMLDILQNMRVLLKFLVYFHFF